MNNYKLPYTKLAIIYDQIMNHVNYKKWGLYLNKLFRYAKIDVKNILDLACGTGNLLTYLNDFSFCLKGCDLSKEMIFRAKEKKSMQKISLFCCDAREISLKKECFDAVVFIYDSINYVLNRRDILKIFKEIQQILRVGGVFIFDTITISHCKKFFNNYNYSEFWKNYGYYQECYFKEKESLQYTDFLIYINHEIFIEKHANCLILNVTMAISKIYR